MRSLPFSGTKKEKLKKIKLPVIEAIAKALAVDPAWLLGQTDCPTPAAQEPVIDNLLPLPKTYRIPLIGDIACGTPILADENIEAILEVPEHIRGRFCAALPRRQHDRSTHPRR